MKLRYLAAAFVLIATPALAQSADAPAAKPAAPAAAAQTGVGVGVVKAVNAAAGSVTLHHGPIAALGWPAMTMAFKADPLLLKDLKAGQAVRFTVRSDEEVIAISPQ